MSKLTRKLAEGAGFKLIPRFGGTDMSETVWRYPDGSCYEALPNFTKSLDACFKWLVPKILRLEYSVIITQDLGRAIGYIRPLQVGRQFDAVDNKNPALALCLAIEKLIDGGKQ